MDIGFIKFNSTNKIHQCNMVNNQDYSYGSAWCGLKWTNETATYFKERPLGLPQDYCRRCFRVAIVNDKPIGIWSENKEDK